MYTFRWLVFCIVIFLFNLNLVSFGYSATYYVKNTGNDASSGLSDQEAWKTISKINRFNFSNGDVVKLRRDDSWSDATLHLANGSDNMTIEDYGSGHKPLLDGDLKQPIYISKALSNLTIRNLDVSGQDFLYKKEYNIRIHGVNEITIDGIDMNGHKGGNTENQEGKSFLYLYKTTGTVTVKNCTVYNLGPDNVLDDERDIMGIVIHEVTSGSINIHNNTIHTVGGDGIHAYLSTVTQNIYSNTLYNFGEQAIDIKGSSNMAIYENTLYTEAGFKGGSGGTGGGIPKLIGCAYISEYPNDNITIHDNIFNGSSTIAILMAHSNNANVYGNYIEDCAGAIFLASTVGNAQIHHNIIVNPRSRVADSSREAGGIYQNTGNREPCYFYNNTIYNNSGTCKRPFNIQHSPGGSVKHNVVYMNHNDEDAYAFYRNSYGIDPMVESNCWYNNSHVNRVNWRGKIYTDQAVWRAAEPPHPGEIFANPLFNDPQHGDFSLKTNSTCRSGSAYWGALPLPLSAPSAPTELRKINP